MSFFNQHKKQIVVTALCAACLFAGGVAVVQAARQQADFDPSRYAGSHTTGDEDVTFDTSLFGGSRQNSDGLEMDESQPEDHSLEEGDQNIRDEQTDTQATDELQIVNGTGGTGTPGATAKPGATTVTMTDGNNNGGGTVTVPSGGGTGGAGGGAGGGTEPGTGGGGDKPKPTKAPASTPTPVTPVKPTPAPSPYVPDEDDDDPYGVDYDTPEKVKSDYPDEGDDDKNHITSKKLTVKGTLLVHFYPGERPRTSEMKKYITVDATMSDGKKRTGLQYCQDPAFGGDYTVTWGGGKGDCVGTKPGTYTATITYRGMTYKMKYDIVVWQVTLYDFEEKAPGFKPLEQVVKPGNTPIVDITNAMDTMYDTIADRTLEGGYRHVNVLDTTSSNVCYSSYFGGWSTTKGGTAAVGERYKMPRPGDADVVKGVYNVKLYPVWVSMDTTTGKLNPYFIVLQKNDELDKWQTKLIAYDPNQQESPKKLVVPAGVAVVDLEEMDAALDIYMSYYGTDYSALEEISLPKTVSAFTPASGERSSYNNLRSITVDVGNQYYMSVDGILYNKMGKKLICCPQAKTSIKAWSERVEEIGPDSFFRVKMDTLSFPEAVNVFGAGAFYDADIGTMEINTTKRMEWGAELFANEAMDDDFNYRLTVEHLIVHSTELPKLPATGAASCFQFSSTFAVWDYEHTYEKLRITVPDSEKNRLYMDWLSLLQQHLDTASGVPGAGFHALCTPKAVQKDYSVDEKGNLLSLDGATLVMAAKGSETLIIPETITALASDALAGQDKLQSIIFRSSTPPQIADDVFGQKIPSGLQIYVPDVEAYQNALSYITSHSDAKVFGNGAEIEIYNGSFYIQNDPEDPSSLTLVSFDCSQTYANVKGFKTDDFEFKNVTKVGDGAFAGCKKLRAVTFSDSVQELGSRLFTGCPLKLAAFNGMIPPAVAADAFADGEAACYLPEGALDDYAAVAEQFASVHEPAYSYDLRLNGTDSVALYGETGLFYDLTVLKYVSGGGDVFNIDLDATIVYPGAFEGCSEINGLDALVIYEIGENAFAGCGNIATVDFGSIPVCGENAFAGCTFESVTLGDYSTGDIGTLTTDELEPFNTAKFLGLRVLADELDGSFLDWPNLTDFSTLYGDTTYGFAYIGKYGDDLFTGCTNMKSFSLAVLPEEMGDATLQGCTGYDLTVGDYYVTYSDMESTYMEPFNQARNLTFGGYIVDDAENPAAQTFGGSFATWPKLESFAAENSVPVVGDGLFDGCKKLKMATFQSVKVIGSRSFANCPKLSTVMLTNWFGDIDIAADAFAGCRPNLAVYVNYSPYDYTTAAPQDLEEPEPATPESGAPAATPEPTPAPIATPEPEPTAEPTATPAPTATAEPEPTAEPTATPAPAATAEPEPAPEPTATPEPEPTEEPTPTPAATTEPEPTPEPEPTEQPEPTPEPAVQEQEPAAAPAEPQQQN